jgi:hypothetical protein
VHLLTWSLMLGLAASQLPMYVSVRACVVA